MGKSTCSEVCIFDQAFVVEGRSTVGEGCKSCGRCATRCPNGARKVLVEDSRYIDLCIERLKVCVDLS